MKIIRLSVEHDTIDPSDMFGSIYGRIFLNETFDWINLWSNISKRNLRLDQSMVVMYPHQVPISR